MKRLLTAAILCALLAGCTGKTTPAPTATPVPDYTVVAKNRYASFEGSGRHGFYVTIVVGGVERETVLGLDNTVGPCWNKATLGSILPTECR